MSEVKVRKKRVLKKSFVTLVSLSLILIISLFKIPDFIKTRNLEDLGFNNEAIKAIKRKGLSKEIIDAGYYSDYLNSEVIKDEFKAQYLPLYVSEDKLNQDDFLLYDKLVKKGYSEQEVINLFKELNFNELVAMLVFDKMDNFSNYISDCLKNRSTNSGNNLILDGNYLNPYSNTSDALGLNTNEVLVSKKYSLNNYIPSKLVPLSTRYASSGVHLDNDAYGAFIKMCDDMSSQGLNIYALSGYRSYDDQKNIYDGYGSSEEADMATTRPGFSEAQTGLSVIVVDSANESLSNFSNTEEFKFIKEHAHEYGFIIRYPENKAKVTGYEYTPYQLRYLGIEKATAVHSSGLTWEEYYLLKISD